MTAISQPMLSPREETTPTSTNSSVVIQITPEALTPCLEFMLSQHISFEVQYKMKETVSQALPMVTQPRSSLPLPQNNIVSNNIANEIYNKYIREISENPLPELPQIAAEFGVSPSKVKDLFKKTYNQTLYQIYMEARMEKSAELLRRGYRANTVSKMVGYGEKSAIKFNKMFQKHFGITPKRYQVQFLNKKQFK